MFCLLQPEGMHTLFGRKSRGVVAFLSFSWISLSCDIGFRGSIQPSAYFEHPRLSGCRQALEAFVVPYHIKCMIFSVILKKTLRTLSPNCEMHTQKIEDTESGSVATIQHGLAQYGRKQAWRSFLSIIHNCWPCSDAQLREVSMSIRGHDWHKGCSKMFHRGSEK